MGVARAVIGRSPTAGVNRHIGVVGKRWQGKKRVLVKLSIRNEGSERGPAHVEYKYLPEIGWHGRVRSDHGYQAKVDGAKVNLDPPVKDSKENHSRALCLL